ncbi:CinA family protein [Nitrospirillum amazonense]|uniref:Nicotinamide-nucleotide amidase n=1 Tax=Nitrospirillum amazonense TaxID=28077 RepID=A0A560K950_9PROT|nr:CinA family protein [Nitrospirillum amazonense]MDG3441653.1 CinA family protein [Nitrospirillum amazonense]TWB79855.1 nicotinamide-nucleotide amidase [Nitrospirillum amazonense]
MFPAEITRAAERLLAACQASGLWLATAESCTGGLISASLTAIAGSSAVVDRGVVTYSNQAKIDLLGVPDGLIALHGAVSREVAHAMAEGLLARSRADIALSVTGIAGPGGGSLEKPVGLVYLGCARRDRPVAVERHVFSGDREAVRLAAVARALAMGLAAAGGGATA